MTGVQPSMRAVPEDAEVLAYADGSPMRDGDIVLMEQDVLGRVSEVVDSHEQAAERHVQGTGVVVDARPKGYVFLSGTTLREASLRLVRRGPNERVRMHLSIAVGFGFLLLLPALYSLIGAIRDAVMTGEVLVISLGRTETHREMVPWQNGWARFAGPVILLASLCAFDSSRGVSARWWLAGTGVTAALALLGFSFWFASPVRAFGFLGFLGFVPLAFFVDSRFGRWPAFLLIAAGAAIIFWAVAL